jgi:hypothetical protein
MHPASLLHSVGSRAPRPSMCRLAAILLAPLALALPSGERASAQERPFWEQGDSSGDRRASPTPRVRRDDAFRPPQESFDGPAGGFGRQAGPDGRAWDGRQSSPGGQPYGQAYGQPPGGYAQGPGYDPRYDQPTQQPGSGPQGYGTVPPSMVTPGYGPGPAPRRDDAWRPPPPGGPGYQPDSAWRDDRGFQRDGGGGFGQPYSPPPDPSAPGYGQAYNQDGRPDGRADDRRWSDQRGPGTYSQNEVVDAGHRFFGSISQGLARSIERLFRNQGQPNGYILGEDAGGAFVAGLRYGEGLLYTKDRGNHRVFWQGPSLGYDFGGEGSKTMVLVYNLRDPSDIYARFGGVQGAAYVIGGVSVQFQTYEHVTLAVIRSGVGLRLGANVGYLKYTRTPTWNPF